MSNCKKCGTPVVEGISDLCPDCIKGELDKIRKIEEKMTPKKQSEDPNEESKTVEKVDGLPVPTVSTDDKSLVSSHPVNESKTVFQIAAEAPPIKYKYTDEKDTPKPKNPDEFNFEDTFEEKLLATFIRNLEFFNRNNVVIRFDYFTKTDRRDIFEIIQDYVGKYGHAISKEDLKNEIQKVFYKKKIQHSTLDSYWEYVDELFAVDLSGEQYTEDEVLRFAQQQNMKKTLLDASHKMVNHQDFLSIEVAGKTIPLSERIRQIEGIGSKTISWESLPTVTDLKPSITTWLVDEIIPFKAITIFHGSGGLGKSHIAWYLGNCVAEGQSFLNHSVKQCPVYYIDYENPSAVEVGDKNDPGFKMKFGDNKMIVFPSDLLPPKLDSKQWNIYKSFPPGLFIFDSLKSSHSLDPNSDKDMGLILDHMNELKALGNTVIALQHTPRSDETRSKGSKVITDQADLNIGLILQKEPGEDKEDEPEPNKPYVVFFGSRKEHKSRYRKHQIYIELSLGEIGAEKIFKVIGSPSDVLLPNVRQMLIEKIQAGDGFPNQNTFGKWIVERFNVKSHRAGKLIKLGDPKYWKGVEHKQGRVRSTEYRPAGFSKYDELGD